MNPFLIMCWAYVLWNTHQAQRAAKGVRDQYTRLISAPSPSTSVFPSSTSASTVTITQVSVEESYFTLTSWLSPPSESATSTPAFAPGDIPEPITTETLAPGLSVTNSLIILLLIVVTADLFVSCGHRQESVENAQRSIDLPEETPLSWCDSIASTTSYDWHDCSTLWHLAVAKFESDAKERGHKAEKLRLRISILDYSTKLNSAREQTRQARAGYSHGSAVRYTWEAMALRRMFFTGSARLFTGSTRLDSGPVATDMSAESGPAQPASTAGSDPTPSHRMLPPATTSEEHESASSPAIIPELASAEPTAETSHQDVTLDNAKHEIPPQPAATESPITEAEEASPSENGTEQAEPTAETSHQDVTLDNTGDKITPPHAATESPITEAEEASPSENGTEQAEPIGETSHQDVTLDNAGDQICPPPVATESPITEAEEASPSENGTEQVEEEEPLTGTPAFEPISLGEGAAQIPQDQEEEAAPSAPVPSEEPAASLQLTEPEAALGLATSDDGASEAPVATEIVPGEPIGDREPEEPTAGAVSDEVPGTTPSDDGVPMAPVTHETEPDEPVGDEPEGPTAVESDKSLVSLAGAPENDALTSGHEIHDVDAPSESLATGPPSYEPSNGTTEEPEAQDAELTSETPLLDDDVQMSDEVLSEDIDMDGEDGTNETVLAPKDDPRGQGSAAYQPDNSNTGFTNETTLDLGTGSVDRGRAAFDPNVFLADLATETPLNLETGAFGQDSVFYDPTGGANETQQDLGIGTFGQDGVVYRPSHCFGGVTNETLLGLGTGTFDQGGAVDNPNDWPTGLTNEMQLSLATGTFGQGSSVYDPNHCPTGFPIEMQRDLGTGTYGQVSAVSGPSYCHAGVASGTQLDRNMYLGQDSVDANEPGLVNGDVPSEMAQPQSIDVGGLSSVPSSTVPGDSTAANETPGDLDMDREGRNAGANEPGPLEQDFANQTVQPQSMDFDFRCTVPSSNVPGDSTAAVETQQDHDMDHDGRNAGANEPEALRQDSASETAQPQSMGLGGHGSVPSDTVPQDTGAAIERQPPVDMDMDMDREDPDEDDSDEDDTLERELLAELAKPDISGRRILAPRGRWARLTAARQAELLAEQAEAHAAMPPDPEHDSDLDSEPETPQVLKQKILGSGGVPRDVPRGKPSTAPQTTPQLPQPPPQPQTGSWKTAFKGSPGNPLYESDIPSPEVAAKTIERWVDEAYKEWGHTFQGCGTFRLCESPSLPKFEMYRTIAARMAWSAEFLEHGRENWSLEGLLNDAFVEQRVRLSYTRFSIWKKCENIFEPMLNDVARMIARLKALEKQRLDMLAMLKNQE